ncbi:hypothetical protein PC116_g9604 [Phytophthora cactorum]|nr:hypothetical protein PC116_g9604 [Phytophthora cactorum]
MHPAAQRAAPPKRRASYTAREKLDAANALEATKDVVRVIKERYPDLSASAYESRRISPPRVWTRHFTVYTAETLKDLFL